MVTKERITEQRVTAKLPFECMPSPNKVFERSGIRVVVGGSSRYVLTTRGNIEPDAIVYSPIWSINAPRIEETMEIWGTTCKHLRLPEEKLPEITVKKEIDVNNLVGAINATDEEVNQWLGLLLEDYDIEPTVENIEAAGSLLRIWLEQQVSKSGLKLEEDELLKVFRFAVRLAYEALYVGSV